MQLYKLFQLIAAFRIAQCYHQAICSEGLFKKIVGARPHNIGRDIYRPMGRNNNDCTMQAMLFYLIEYFPAVHIRQLQV